MGVRHPHLAAARRPEFHPESFLTRKVVAGKERWRPPEWDSEAGRVSARSLDTALSLRTMRDLSIGQVGTFQLGEVVHLFRPAGRLQLFIFGLSGSSALAWNGEAGSYYSSEGGRASATARAADRTLLRFTFRAERFPSFTRRRRPPRFLPLGFGNTGSGPGIASAGRRPDLEPRTADAGALNVPPWRSRFLLRPRGGVRLPYF